MKLGYDCDINTEALIKSFMYRIVLLFIAHATVSAADAVCVWVFLFYSTVLFCVFRFLLLSLSLTGTYLLDSIPKMILFR